MDLTHTFTVPVDVEEAWAHFNDIAEVAQCFPGAQVTAVENDTFNGSVKVKLGPIALQYNGSGTFVEKDDDNHRFVVDAKGKDKRGNGTAGARVTLTFAGDETSTDVAVVTDLNITGKPAQFGRGVLQDVSDKLLGQFVSCLEHRLGLGEVDPEPPAAPSPAPEPAAVPAAEPSPERSVPDPQPAADQPAASAFGKAPPPPTDYVNVGATVLPVLAKNYWKPLAGALTGVLLLRWWLRRRR